MAEYTQQTLIELFREMLEYNHRQALFYHNRAKDKIKSGKAFTYDIFWEAEKLRLAKLYHWRLLLSQQGIWYLDS